MTTLLSTFEEIKQPVLEKLELVDKNLGNINSSVPLINEISKQILSSGGKRLRPLITLLCGECFGETNNTHIQLASIVELIHAATLLHDDVIDNSTKRRRKPTANFIWDNKLAILGGDFVYSLAFKKMTSLNNTRILDILAGATSYIVEGEVIQLTQNQNTNLTIDEYIQVIDRKTARLFKIAAHLGAIASNQEEDKASKLAQFGQNFGLAYQIINDILDYTDNTEITGKNYGDDLAEGKPTLPFILAYQNATEEEKAILNHAIQTNPDINLVAPIIKRTKSLEMAKNTAREFLTKATTNLESIPSSSGKKSLESLCELVGKKLDITNNF